MQPLGPAPEEARVSGGAPGPRSWLFVPADSNKKMMKALGSEADAVIFDLEDSVAPGCLPIHAIVTETAASLFGLLSYTDAGTQLAAMSWGAEDLSAALGASS